VTITGCTEGTVIPEFAAGAAADAAGNAGPATAATSTTTITIDRTAPTATLAAVTASPTNAAALTYTLTFSEAVTGVAAGDFSNTGTATGCAFDPGTDSGASRTVTISSCSNGTVVPRLAINAATDAAGNTGPAAAADGSSITIDRTAPTVSSFSSAQATPTTAASFTYTLTFSEAVTGVAAGDFTNTGTATGCAFAPGADTGTTRTVTVTSCSDGTVIPRFAANGATDGANTGPASAFVGDTIVRDAVAPDVSSFTATTPTLTNGANVVYALTFTKNVTGVTAGDEVEDRRPEFGVRSPWRHHAADLVAVVNPA
jgi:hypothetical protein